MTATLPFFIPWGGGGGGRGNKDSEFSQELRFAVEAC